MQQSFHINTNNTLKNDCFLLVLLQKLTLKFLDPSVILILSHIRGILKKEHFPFVDKFMHSATTQSAANSYANTASHPASSL